MASLKLSLSMPKGSNVNDIRDYMEKLLFSPSGPEPYTLKRREYSAVGRVIYSVFLIIPVLLIVLLLRRLGFNIVQMIIFYTFFSTASFLGFRLSNMVRELELTNKQLGLLANLRDLFYLPFTVSGQWLSRKYSKINIVARFLDVAIELPLKTILRLLRQWVNFLNDKREELY